MWRLNATADNSVPLDIGRSLHRREAWAVGESSSLTSGENCTRLTCTYRLQLIVSLKTQVQQSLYLARRIPVFTGRSRTRWDRCGFCELR
jgi:hypothetical protein